MKKFSFLLLFCGILSSGCATVYFPMEKQSYFETEKAKPKTIMVMPFDVDPFIFFNKYNTRELLDKKIKAADEYVIRALKEELNNSIYKIIDDIPFEEIEKDDFDQDHLRVIGELFDELRSAKYAISKNMKDEKGKPFDYCVGIRAEELSKMRSQNPDLLLFVYVSGYIANLSALETNAMNTMQAILSLGLSLAIPTPDDTILVEVVLVDAKTGDIVWLNSELYPSQSLLIYNHIRDSVKSVFKKLPLKMEIKNDSQPKT